jgi:hypothetical protein
MACMRLAAWFEHQVKRGEEGGEEGRGRKEDE